MTAPRDDAAIDALIRECGGGPEPTYAADALSDWDAAVARVLIPLRKTLSRTCGICGGHYYAAWPPNPCPDCGHMNPAPAPEP
jgi:hypothetical protein